MNVPLGSPGVRALLSVLAVPALLAACVGDGPLEPPPPVPPTAPHVLGVMEITIGGIGSASMYASATSLPPVGGGVRFNTVAVAEGARSGVQLRPIGTGSFTQGVRGSGGERYMWASFAVRNASPDGTPYTTPRQNLTFLAVGTATTVGAGATPVSALRRFDGGAITGDAATAIAAAMRPTGGTAQVGGRVIAGQADVLQAFTEAEVEAIGTADFPAITNRLPYGFVTRNANVAASRTIPVVTAAETERFDGVVTFAFRVPLQATSGDDPFTVSVRVLALDDTETRVTESPEEQGTSLAQQRSDELGATSVRLLGNSATVIARRPAERICRLRTAGTDPQSPAGTLVDAGGCTAGFVLPSNVRVVNRVLPGAAQDGTTWNRAFRNLQDALACVRTGSVTVGGLVSSCAGVDEIWVAAGPNYPDEGEGITDNDEFAVFQLVPSVGLYGGFAGSEQRRDQRNWATHRTIISGDVTGDDPDPDGDFIIEGPIYAGNSPGMEVVGTASAPVTASTVVDGFTVTAAGSIERTGGGLYIRAEAGGECSPTIRNMVFAGNTAKYGSAIDISAAAAAGTRASPRVQDVTFIGNWSWEYGGAVRAIAGAGSAVEPVFLRVAFRGNQAENTGGAVVGDGTGTTLSFVNAAFHENYAPVRGALTSRNGASLTVINATFWRNRSGGSPAIYASHPGKLHLVNVTLAENVSDWASASLIENSAGAQSTTAHNLIVWGHVLAPFDYPPSVVLSHSILEGGCPSGATCSGVLNQNPMFLSASTGDLRLMANSPGVDAGSNTWLPDDIHDLDGDGDTSELLPLDVAGLARVAGAHVDMGAHERP